MRRGASSFFGASLSSVAGNGQRLRLAPQEAGPSLQELGRALGIALVQTPQQERMAEARLAGMAQHLGIGTAILQPGPAESAPASTDDGLVAEAAALLGRIQPPSRRLALLQLMQVLAGQEEGQAGFAERQAPAPVPLASAPEDAALAERLRQAILQPGAGLLMRYQPVVDARDGRLLGFEALLRWTTPDGVSIPPERCFALARAHELEEALEFWVLQEAVMRSAEWLLQRPGLTLAVNVAGALLTNSLGIAMVRALLRSTGIQPASLCLELTETMLLDEAARANLAAMRQLGVKVAIDDFGTGQSSLSRLLDLDVDVVKLDRSFFVGRDGVREGDLAFLRAIVRMAHARRATVVAEGIARPEDEAMARRAGCDACQGFWYAQALSAEAAAELTREAGMPWQHSSDRMS